LARGKIDTERINRLITYKEGTGARRELVSVFNFIPFYLPFISRDFDRIVYLDADVVVVVSNSRACHFGIPFKHGCLF